MLTVYRRLIAAHAGGGGVKILALSNLYPPDFIGGYELACTTPSTALPRRGHDVRVADRRSRASRSPTAPARARTSSAWLDVWTRTP